MEMNHKNPGGSPPRIGSGTKAGLPCPKCGGSVLPMIALSELDAEEVMSCVQCGHEPFLPRPSAEELASLRRKSNRREYMEGRPQRPKAPTSGYAGPPERARGTTFVCRRPGCGRQGVRRADGTGVYCSRECRTKDRPSKRLVY